MSDVNKIIVHMGFHKTGTTSLQAYLQDYKKEFKPHCDIFMMAQLGKLATAGRYFGQFPSFGRRILFRRALRSFLAEIKDAPTIVISRESFCGIMPGHRRFGFITAYSVGWVARILAREMVRGLRKRFGEDTEIILLYTTRDRNDWIGSVWGHVVRSINMKLNKAQFMNKMKKFKSLDDEVEKIRSSVKGAHVVSASLDALKKHPLGPAGAITDLLELPDGWADKHPVKSVNNVGETAELQQRFLEMNRTIKDKKLLAKEKAKLADELRTIRGFRPKFETKIENESR